MPDIKSYRFKVTAPDGTSKTSDVFEWPPKESIEASAIEDDDAVEVVAHADDAGGAPESASSEPDSVDVVAHDDDGSADSGGGAESESGEQDSVEVVPVADA